jgi:hypothetical protein
MDISVPISAVSQASETGPSVPPEVGDAVTLTIEGKVTGVDGDMCQVTPETANGEPLPTSEVQPMSDETSLGQEEAGLRGDLMASQEME